MRRYISLGLSGIFLLSCLAVTPVARAQFCSAPTGTGTPDPYWNAEFTQNGPGWTGGDGTSSVLLPDGRSLFFFSDSYIGTVDPTTRLRTNPIFQAHNSMVVIGTDGSFTSIYGGTISSPTSYFVPANPNDWYWLNEAVVVQTAPGIYKVELLMGEWTGNFVFVGNAVATLSLPGLAIDSVQTLNIPNTQIDWGSSLWLQGSDLYIYGTEFATHEYAHLAKANVGQIAQPSAWLFWNGSSWVSDEENSVRIISDSVSTGFSVRKIHSSVGDSYLLVTEDTSPFYTEWKDIVFYYACSPQGPWSPKQVVYSTPETGQSAGAGTLFTYDPHAHVQFTSNGELLVSYNLNSTEGTDLVQADDYRPKFIRVPIAGLR
jgi:uncharacterized protein DUF4185/uncharacterized protein DUF5005